MNGCCRFPYMLYNDHEFLKHTSNSMYYGAKKNGVEDLYYVMNDISYPC